MCEGGWGTVIEEALRMIDGRGDRRLVAETGLSLNASLTN